MGDFTRPPALKPGDRLRVIAPSGPFDHELFFRGVGWLSERYRVELSEHVLAREGFLAGSDAERLADLDAALSEPGVRAVVAARGGYGAIRIAHRGAFDALARDPKWLVGFSDVTALHLEAARVGVASLHAEHATGLGRADAEARLAWIDALEFPLTRRLYPALTSLRGGAAEGTLLGGNLTVLFSAHAAGRLNLPSGALLVLEDVTEASYRIDRMLSALLIAGALDGVAGVVLGDFTDCSAGPHGVPVEAVLQERLSTLGVPILSGLRIGHGHPNLPLQLGSPARLDASAGELLVG